MSTMSPEVADDPESERARRDLAALGQTYARPRSERWQPVPEALDQAIAADARLVAVARAARRDLGRYVSGRLTGLIERDRAQRFEGALASVPRERFVLPEEIGSSADDAPSPLDPQGFATVSAPHAYVLTYDLLDLREGDHLLELGTGTGYGAAIASHVVGPRGRVTSIEIDPVLHERARRVLADPTTHGPAPIALHLGDARALALQVADACRGAPEPLRVAITYALPRAPDALIARLPEGGRLVAPVGVGDDDQILLSWTLEGGALRHVAHGPVRYVAERG